MSSQILYFYKKLKFMDSNVAINKLELTKWIIDLEDENILDEIMRLMKYKKETHFYTEEEARHISQEKIAKWANK